MDATLAERGRQGLMDRLSLFFEQYIPGLDVPAMNIIDGFDGLQFLPLAKAAYLGIQSLVNLVESKIP